MFFDCLVLRSCVAPYNFYNHFLGLIIQVMTSGAEATANAITGIVPSDDYCYFLIAPIVKKE